MRTPRAPDCERALDCVPAAGDKPARRVVVLTEMPEAAQIEPASGQVSTALRASLYAMNQVNPTRCQERQTGHAIPVPCEQAEVARVVWSPVLAETEPVAAFRAGHQAGQNRLADEAPPKTGGGLLLCNRSCGRRVRLLLRMDGVNVRKRKLIR